MRAVVQRVSEASVSIAGKTVGAIGKGFLILLGITGDDTRSYAPILPKNVPACGFSPMKMIR